MDDQAQDRVIADRAMTIEWPSLPRHSPAQAGSDTNVEAREGEPVMNRYRIELRHPDLDGTDGEVLAESEDDALAQAAALAPEGATVHRVVLMEVDYEAPPTGEPPPEVEPPPPPPPVA